MERFESAGVPEYADGMTARRGRQVDTERSLLTSEIAHRSWPGLARLSLFLSFNFD